MPAINKAELKHRIAKEMRSRSAEMGYDKKDLSESG